MFFFFFFFYLAAGYSWSCAVRSCVCVHVCAFFFFAWLCVLVGACNVRESVKGGAFADANFTFFFIPFSYFVIYYSCIRYFFIFFYFFYSLLLFRDLLFMYQIFYSFFYFDLFTTVITGAKALPQTQSFFLFFSNFFISIYSLQSQREPRRYHRHS